MARPLAIAPDSALGPSDHWRGSAMKNDAPPGMPGLIEFFARAERGDDHRHLVLLAKRKILFEPVVRPVHDLVNRERRRQPVGMRLVVRGKLLLDPRQPLVEQRGGRRGSRRTRS